MENKTINIKLVAQVAEALKELKDQMVFVGGAVISVYTDDPAADEIRPTGDIDLTIQLRSYGEWVSLNEQLLALGFTPNPDGASICNYLYKGIEVDIMPTSDTQIGVSNSWYEPGLKFVEQAQVEGIGIKIFSSPYFIATKFEAFNNRGSDFRTSHDFEDIIYIIDNRTSIVEEIKSSDEIVKEFLITSFKKVMEQQAWKEIIISQIQPLMIEDRFPLIVEKINLIIGEKS
jgi:predicted nucleotidyltransferase